MPPELKFKGKASHSESFYSSVYSMNVLFICCKKSLLGSDLRSGFIPRITQTASSTNFTADGGFFIDLTMVMSGGLSVFNAANAALNAGIASCKSPSQSSLFQK